jgi:hypothetical protein
MPAYIPPHLRKKLVEKPKKRQTKKQLRFPSNTTGDNSRNVSFAPVSKLFSETVSSVYKVFSSALQTRKLRRKPLTKVLKSGKKEALRPQSASPPKKTMKQKRPASV